MKHRKSDTQRWLFEGGAPCWDALDKEAQSPLLDILAQLLLDAVQRCGNTSITTQIREENNHDD